MTQFQTQVNVQPAPAVEGDFASANPRASVLAGPNALVAGAAGLTVARFAWVDPTYTYANNYVSVQGGAPNGFVHREQQALITAFLASNSNLVPSGLPVTLMNAGDFWVKNGGTTEALPGQKAYAVLSSGVATFAASGAPSNGGTSTASTIAAGTATNSTAASITGNVMTVTGGMTGSFVVGGLLSGTNVAAGTQIVAILSGTGGVGTYQVSIPEQLTGVQTITQTYGLLTVGGTVAGSYGVGDLITGSSTAANTIITAFGTGSGGAGTYIVNLTQTVTSAALNATSNIETGWYCRSFGAPGELVKISSLAMG